MTDSVSTLFKTTALSPEADRASNAGLEFIAYLRMTWLSYPLWYGWSRKGRLDAASRMGVMVDTVLSTTNHLESFNGVLKRRYIPQWQHSGRRLRLDVLLVCMSVDVMPRIFARRRVLVKYETWKKGRFGAALKGPTVQHPSDILQGLVAPLTWYEVDDRRDKEAEVLYSMKYLSPMSSRRPYELWATCQSSRAWLGSPTASHYWLTAHPSGVATCTCKDWLTRGGACKHLRAFRY